MSRKLRVFLVDRRPSTHEMNFARLCKAGYEVQRHNAPLGTVKAVFRAHPDVLILDWKLSPLGAERVIGILKNRKPSLRPRILLLGDAEDKQELESDAGRMGVEGYILRDQTGESLVRAVERVARESPPLSQMPAAPLQKKRREQREEHDLPGFWGESELGGF